MIPCIHEGDKIPMKIKFEGNEKDVQACKECVNVIESSSICEVVSSG